MSFRDQLEKLYACSESLEWVGNKSFEEAWKTCKNPQWMLWFLTKTDLDLVDPLCDMAERVLDLVPEKCQLACIWAISAARRRASKDELDAAKAAATDAAYAVSYNLNFPVAAAAYAAEYYGAARTVSLCASSGAAFVVSMCATAADAAAAEKEEENKQCDILREYFTIYQVREAFNKLVA